MLSDPQILMLATALVVKHFAADFLLQNARIIREKGQFGKPGGILHVLWHGGLTLPALLLCGVVPLVAAVITTVEMVVHYAIDYGKDAVSRKLRDTPADRRYWATFGFDQMLHHLCYIAMIAVAAQYPA